MPLSRFRFIVVEGPIGAGKTSLAHRLASRASADLLLEQPDANPFLARFYDDPSRYALQTQIFFLFQRIQQLREVAQLDLFRARIVSDFLFDKDPLFAQLTLGADELALYRQIFDVLKPQAPRPDLVVYLHASVPTLIERVRRRARGYETKLASEREGERYLTGLAEAYSRFFYHYTDAPVLVVNSEHLNFVESDDALAILMERIGAMRGQREYFNASE